MTCNDLMCLMYLMLCWDFSVNDKFSNFSSVLAQTIGTPIGGSNSAQVACLTLLVLENKPCLLHLCFPPVLHYHDNFLLIPHPPEKVNRHDLENVTRVLSEIFVMRLTVEGSSHSLHFLDCTLSLNLGCQVCP